MKFSKLTAVMLSAALISPVVVPSASYADGLRIFSGSSSKSRAAQFQRQTRLMDTRLSTQYDQSAKLKPESSTRIIVGKVSPLASVPAYSGKKSSFMPMARSAARKHGIPENLFLRLVQQESGWNPRARSHKGATGLAQLMPATARNLGVNPHDPAQNLEGGARYLRMMYNMFGNWKLALAAYNAGPGAVKKYGGIPPYRETRNYVRIISGS